MWDSSRCRLVPFKHQLEDTELMSRRSFLFIASEMRTGKTKTVIDAAQIMHFDLKRIDRVLVIAPAPVRDVWYDPVLGELAKHLWKGYPGHVAEYHSNVREWRWEGGGRTKDGRAFVGLRWVITNYEFLRSKMRVELLMPYCGPRTLIVLDESSFVKTWNSAQTKACGRLRRECGYAVLLNGMPVGQTPLDLFSQGNLLHKSVLDCQFITHFRARYGEMKAILGPSGKPLRNPRTGKPLENVASWKNLDDLRGRFRPHTVRRLQKDCMDLPPKLDPQIITWPLDGPTWDAYREMRDETVIWLKENLVASAMQAGVKVMRLAQITSGFVGGVQEAVPELVETLGGCQVCFGLGQIEGEICETCWGTGRSYDGQSVAGGDDSVGIHRDAVDRAPIAKTVELGRDKLDALLWLLGRELARDPNFRTVTWFRFNLELDRAEREVREKFPQFAIGTIRGGQGKAKRAEGLGLLHPLTAPETGPIWVGGTFGTGSFGLNFTAARASITASSGDSLEKFRQGADRIYGPGMIGPAAYYEILMTGPKGQRTIDHKIAEARRINAEIADWVAADWIKALEDE